MRSRKTIVSNLWIWPILEACVSLSWANLNEIPEIAHLDVMSTETHKESRVHVSLTPIESFLANENVPVWITSETLDEADSPLIPQDTMKKLGRFSPYWDSDACSAALYFHKTQQFEGNIGNHYIIHKLKYNLVTSKVEPTAETIFPSPLQKHRNRNRNEYVKGVEVDDRVKSHRPSPKIVYVETLVMIDYDMAEDFENDYTSIVIYVLSLFNSVDMLYSQIKKPNIKINIAGIIIATKPFRRFTPECYGTPELGKNQSKRVLITLPSVLAMQRTLEDYKHDVPLQSYDIAVLLTSAYLVRDVRPRGRNLGVSLPAEAQYKRSTGDVGVAIATNSEHFGNFPTVAHEIAHLLGVPHDEGPLFSENGKCIGNLMRRYGSSCVKCLRFGGTTPRHLTTFFSSRAGCIFHNKPRSLNHLQSPQIFWSPCEQCECYGFESVRKSRSCFPFSVFSPKLVNCDSYLECLDQYGEIYTTNVYMDGTPCARNRNGISVCWNQECVRLSADSERARKNDGAV